MKVVNEVCQALKNLEIRLTTEAMGEFKAIWKNAAGTMELNQLTGEETQVITGNGMVSARIDDVPSNEQVPALIIRKTGKSILFNSLLVPTASGLNYSVKPYRYILLGKEKPLKMINAYEISNAQYSDIVYYNYNQNLPVKLGPFTTDAALAMVRTAKGAQSEIFIAGGSTVSTARWNFHVEELTVGSRSDIGVLHLSLQKGAIEVKNDAQSTVTIRFSKQKVKSVETFKNGKWVPEEPVETTKDSITLLANPGDRFKLIF
jgi:hypothetical protein